MTQFDPRCHLSSASYIRLEQDALLHGVSRYVIDPRRALGWGAESDDAFDSGALRFDDIEMQATARTPGDALPSHTRPRKFRKPRPVPAISEDLPSHSALGPGKDDMVDADEVRRAIRHRQLPCKARLGPG